MARNVTTHVRGRDSDLARRVLDISRYLNSVVALMGAESPSSAERIDVAVEGLQAVAAELQMPPQGEQRTEGGTAAAPAMLSGVR
jgi:hypothetical protein